jgi:hypothetical protein
MARKSPAKTPMRVPKHGKGALRVGGTNKGGPGRPPDEFKEMCRQLASREETLKQVQAILGDPDHGQFMAALKWATENGYGKAPQSVSVTGAEGGPVEHIHRVLKWGDMEIPL